MKKILALITALALMCSMFVCVSAAGDPTFAMSSTTVEAGEQATLELSVLNNPGITALTVFVSYDDTYISLAKKATYSGLFSGGAATPGGDINANPYKVIWSEDFNDFTESGVFATYVFDVAEDAPAGDYEIVVTYSSTYDANMDDVEFTTVNGVITVGGEEEPEAPSYTNPTFAMSSTTVEAGEQATLELSVLNNPGITALTVFVSYDDTYISLAKKATYSGLFSGGAATPGGDINANPYKVIWSEDFNNFTESGVFATYVFNVAENAPAGDYEIVVTYSSTYDADMEDVEFDTVNGKITVEGEPAPSYNYAETKFNNGALEVAHDFAGNYKLIVVAYANDGKTLVKAEFIDVTAADADKAIVLADKISATGTSYKAMLWADDVNCKPILNAIGWN